MANWPTPRTRLVFEVPGRDQRMHTLTVDFDDPEGAINNFQRGGSRPNYQTIGVPLTHSVIRSEIIPLLRSSGADRLTIVGKRGHSSYWTFDNLEMILTDSPERTVTLKSVEVAPSR